MLNLKQLLIESYDKDYFAAKFSSDPDHLHNLATRYHKQVPQNPGDVNINDIVVQNANTHAKTLHFIASNNNDAWIKRQIIRHPNTGSDTLVKYSKDPDVNIRLQASLHPNMPLRMKKPSIKVEKL